jgi:hypothetical protein
VIKSHYLSKLYLTHTQSLFFFHLPSGWITANKVNPKQPFSGTEILFRWHHIDYRCEDGRFIMSARCVTSSDPDSLSSSKTGVNLEIEAERSTCQIANCKYVVKLTAY